MVCLLYLGLFRLADVSWCVVGISEAYCHHIFFAICTVWATPLEWSDCNLASQSLGGLSLTKYFLVLETSLLSMLLGIQTICRCVSAVDLVTCPPIFPLPPPTCTAQGRTSVNKKKRQMSMSSLKVVNAFYSAQRKSLWNLEKPWRFEWLTLTTVGAMTSKRRLARLTLTGAAED